MARRVFFKSNSDAVLAVFVVAVAAMLLVPLPTPLLDTLLAVNLSFSLLLLLVGVYIPNALALLAFPALLLLTTLFRLALNVASTRLILSNGYAGEVIQAFGDFLIAGDPVIGAVIFTIITIVNFIVITRGAGRVSEVSARFALDALPGKQMAIDADLRAGTISAEEAGRKRDDLRKESQLYGAMDGAMKFVQGDAIAGLCIIATNILGGLYIGVLRNQMSFAEAISNYTILTVGDGLVSQIPALLISICAGIIVTRVSSGENTTLGRDLASQLFQSPFLITVAAVIILCVGLLPGVPFWPFLLTSLAFIAVAVFLRKHDNSQREQTLLRRDAIGFNKNTPDEENVENDIEPVLVSLDSAGLYKIYQSSQLHFRHWYSDFKNDFYEVTGLHLPSIRIVSNDLLPISNFKIEFLGTVICNESIPENSVLLEMSLASARNFGLNVVKSEEHPLSGQVIVWCNDTTMIRNLAEAGSIKIHTPMEYIALRMAAFLNQYPEDILSIVNVHAELKDIQQKYPGLIQETFNSEFINVSRVTTILQELAREGISIRNFRLILESVAAYCSAFGASMVQEDDFDVQDIVSFIRTDRKRQILGRFLTNRGTIKVITLSCEVEDLLAAGTAELNEPQNIENLKHGIQQIAEPVFTKGIVPVAILCPAAYRQKIFNLLRATHNHIGVITLEELDVTIPLENVGVWHI